MEIRTHTPPAPIPSVSTAKPGEERDNIQAHRRVPPTAGVKADNKVREQQKGDDKPRVVGEERKLPKISRVRLELHIDEDTQKIFGRVFDQETGREIRQIPAESIRHLQAISRQMFIELVDETV